MTEKLKTPKWFIAIKRDLKFLAVITFCLRSEKSVHNFLLIAQPGTFFFQLLCLSPYTYLDLILIGFTVNILILLSITNSCPLTEPSQNQPTPNCCTVPWVWRGQALLATPSGIYQKRSLSPFVTVLCVARVSWNKGMEYKYIAFRNHIHSCHPPVDTQEWLAWYFLVSLLPLD